MAAQMCIRDRDKRAEIDALNTRIYDTLNNGVYKAGFATTQTAYEDAVWPLFDTLDWLEERLGRSRFLLDDALTEADIRLFTTLVRFDSVYHGHFKCCLLYTSPQRVAGTAGGPAAACAGTGHAG